MRGKLKSSGNADAETVEERIEIARQEKIAALALLKQVDFRENLKSVKKSSSDEQEGEPSISPTATSPSGENKGRF